jgi:hypothetical protein
MARFAIVEPAQPMDHHDLSDFVDGACTFSAASDVRSCAIACFSLVPERKVE